MFLTRNTKDKVGNKVETRSETTIREIELEIGEIQKLKRATIFPLMIGVK